MGFILVNGFAKALAGTEKEYGRYQLFQATVHVQNELNNKIEPMPLVFLLDSNTGEVKYYYMGLNKQEIMIGEWMPTKYKTQLVSQALLPIPVPK